MFFPPKCPFYLLSSVWTPLDAFGQQQSQRCDRQQVVHRLSTKQLLHSLFSLSVVSAPFHDVASLMIDTDVAKLRSGDTLPA
jgi:hypothetical protein